VVGGHDEGVVGRPVDGSVEGAVGIGGGGETCERLAFGVVAAAGEFAGEARGRCRRHGAASGAAGEKGAGRLNGLPGDRETMSGDDDGDAVLRRGDGTTEAGPLRRFWTAESGVEAVAREVLISVAVVVGVGMVLFAVSGVWPPMVAVESASMEPQMYRGDLVVISEPGRYVPGDATRGETGVVTAETGDDVGYRTFGAPGSVVVYRPDGRAGTPVIHRASFWVSEGENWYDRADPDDLSGDSCEAAQNCPAPHAGFITKGDNNRGYDQSLGISSPVKSEWVVGVAHVRVPLLGHVRLWLAGNTPSGTVVGVSPATTVAGD
jgi:signal peptidase